MLADGFVLKTDQGLWSDGLPIKVSKICGLAK